MPVRSLVILLCLITLTGACTPQAPDPYAQLSVAELDNLVEAELDNENFSNAADIYAHIVRLEPDNPDRYRRHGEILSAASRWDESVDTYRNALKHFPASDPRIPDIARDLALTYAIPLQEVDIAERLLDLIPADRQLDRLDLQAVFAALRNDPRGALKLLYQASQLVDTTAAAARIDFHSALAYHQLGQEENLYKALFQAVTYSEHLGLSRMIADFWFEIGGGTQ